MLDNQVKAIVDLVNSLSEKDKSLVISELIRQSEKKTETAPLSIFNKKLGALESIVKYLIEMELSIKEISLLLNRSPKTIWSTYHQAKKKYPQKFSTFDFTWSMPLELFKSRKTSVLETLVSYLKDHYQLNFKKIAELLERDYQTVWTVYRRSQKR